jgi:hypothetical protein
MTAADRKPAESKYFMTNFVKTEELASKIFSVAKEMKNILF